VVVDNPHTMVVVEGSPLVAVVVVELGPELVAVVGIHHTMVVVEGCPSLGLGVGVVPAELGLGVVEAGVVGIRSQPGAIH